jgi:hypothetical protein
LSATGSAGRFDLTGADGLSLADNAALALSSVESLTRTDVRPTAGAKPLDLHLISTGGKRDRFVREQFERLQWQFVSARDAKAYCGL